MLKLDGAFAPVPAQRRTGFCRASISPPERFVTAQLSGGLKTLYKSLGKTCEKKDPHKKHQEPGSQTGADGKFQPCYPVPLFAGRYKFVHVIGQGQSAIIVAAEDTFHPDKKPVAVKIMHLDYSRLGAQEADCIQQLNKTDILHVSRTIQLFNVFSFEGHYCLVFELLRPRPLHQYFQKCQFENEEAKFKVIRKIALQLLQALGFLKRENVIHADLKPENILFEEGDEIKIKVVDFGNAIHWVHREVSLYYDEFELQTLLYRAPEVMFGVPLFGPEIDIWSLGCILAELYIGKPLFLGRNKNEVLKEVTSILGPIPRNPFQTGKFFQDLSQFVGHNPEVNQLILVANLMKKLHNSRNYAFASFLLGLLQYNPSERLTPCQAAVHPFLAPDFPYAYLLPQQGDKISDVVAGYTDVMITPEQYISKPHVDEEIKRQHFSGTELLKRGTKVHYNSYKMSPLLTKQKKENDNIKSCSLTTGNPGNTRSSNTVVVIDEKCEEANLLPVENSRYAMEGPLTTSHPTPSKTSKKPSLLHKEKICGDGGKRDERETCISLTSALPTHKNAVCKNPSNDNLFKVNSKNLSDLVEIPKEKNRIPCSYNELEISSVKLQNCQGASNVTPDVSGEYNVQGQLTSENVNDLDVHSQWNCNIVSTKRADNDNRVLHTKIPGKMRSYLDKCCSDDETNVAARTRVYHRKAKSRKLEQPNDLSPEIKHSKLEDPIAGQKEKKSNKSEYQGHSQLVNTSVVDQRFNSRRRRKKMCREPQEQDSKRAGSSGKYLDDEVLLL